MPIKEFEIPVKNPETGNENIVKIREIVPTKGRGANRPKLFPADLAQWKTEDFVRVFGEQMFLKVLVFPRFKQLLSNFTVEACTKSDGKTPETDEKVIQEDFAEMFAKLSQRGETLTDLKNRIEEIQEEELIEALNSGNIKLAITLKDELISLRKELAAKKVQRESSTSENSDNNGAPAAAAPAVA